MQDNQTHKRFPWATALIAATLVILAALALVAYLKTVRGVKDTVDNVFNKMPEIARNFTTGNITTTFRESIPHYLDPGDILELAIYRCDETFKRTDEKWTGWGWVYLGTTWPRYACRSRSVTTCGSPTPGGLAARDKVCLVLAPQVRPSLPRASTPPTWSAAPRAVGRASTRTTSLTPCSGMRLPWNKEPETRPTSSLCARLAANPWPGLLRRADAGGAVAKRPIHFHHRGIP